MLLQIHTTDHYDRPSVPLVHGSADESMTTTNMPSSGDAQRTQLSDLTVMLSVDLSRLESRLTVNNTTECWTVSGAILRTKPDFIVEVR